jgi:hypothetical protein
LNLLDGGSLILRPDIAQPDGFGSDLVRVRVMGFRRSLANDRR